MNIDMFTLNTLQWRQEKNKKKDEEDEEEEEEEVSGAALMEGDFLAKREEMRRPQRKKPKERDRAPSKVTCLD